jgi:hypothetical protein
MRYGSLVASAAVLLGIAACGTNETGMNADLARDLADARSSDALSLAPHAGAQSVVSAAELSPGARARMQSSARSERPVSHRTPHRDRVTPVASEASSDVAEPAPEPVEMAVADVATSATESADVPSPSPRPQPVAVSYPASDPGSAGGSGTGSAIGAIIGAIGGAVLRGGVAGPDHCDPRAHRTRGGGILVNQRGPILRGHF